MNGTYRRIPSTVQAMKYEGQPPVEWPVWAQNRLATGEIHPNGLALSIATDTGPARCNRGDWVIDTGDRVYPAADDFFKANYEAVA